MGASPPEAVAVHAAAKNSSVVATRSAARVSTRSGDSTTMRVVLGRRANKGSIPSASTGARDSIPSTATPSAILLSMSAAAGICSTKAAARSRTFDDKRTSRHGGAHTCGVSAPSSTSIERWSATENRRISSTSSPKNSTRRAESSVGGKISMMPPRTANSPLRDTMSTREYAKCDKCSASSVRSCSSPTLRVTGSRSPSPLTIGCKSARTVVTTTDSGRSPG